MQSQTHREFTPFLAVPACVAYITYFHIAVVNYPGKTNLMEKNEIRLIVLWENIHQGKEDVTEGEKGLVERGRIWKVTWCLHWGSLVWTRNEARI